jgi:hypothetical protein
MQTNSNGLGSWRIKEERITKEITGLKQRREH